MKLVIFGLSVSSSWGNGHATLWRGLINALYQRGHQVVFFERDQPYYAEHRDLPELAAGKLILYPDWQQIASTATEHARDADVVMITSYCVDGVAASELAFAKARGLRCFTIWTRPSRCRAFMLASRCRTCWPRGSAGLTWCSASPAARHWIC